VSWIRVGILGSEIRSRGLRCPFLLTLLRDWSGRQFRTRSGFSSPCPHLNYFRQNERNCQNYFKATSQLLATSPHQTSPQIWNNLSKISSPQPKTFLTNPYSHQALTNALKTHHLTSRPLHSQSLPSDNSVNSVHPPLPRPSTKPYIAFL